MSNNKKKRYVFIENDGTINIIPEQKRQEALSEIRKMRKQIFEIMKIGGIKEITFGYDKMPQTMNSNRYFYFSYK